MDSYSLDLKEKDNITFYDQYYKGSDKINISSYFGDYNNVITHSDFHKHYEFDEKKFIMKVLGSHMNEEKCDLLAEYCSPDNLTVDGELEKMNKNTFEYCKDPYDSSIINSIELQTVKCTKQRNMLKAHQVRAKYRSEKPINYESAPFDCNSAILTPESDILVFLRVYVPFTSRSKQSSGALGKLSLNFVIAMYGSQTLDKLRDMIMCPADHSISIETSDTPSRMRMPNAKDIYKSGFFFIENTFYNDFRDPSNKDNSRVIREWAIGRNLGDYKTAKMEETKVGSLIVRFGFPWVYQHQGDCEHLIAFSDARFVNPTDELYVNCYPRVVRIKPRANRYCMTCGLYNVAWVTIDNDRLPHNPCLFCDSCFKSYNYANLKKIGSFKAYPYPCDSDLTDLCLERTKNIDSLQNRQESGLHQAQKIIKTET